MMFKKTAVALGSGLAMVSSVSMAAAGDFDVSAVTTMLTTVGVGVATIGAAVLIVKFGAKAWKWLSSAG
jgi:uncharacterized membrane protein YgaE (UPF0421/DUF939 family)